MKKRQKLLTEEQWELIEPLLPQPRLRRDRRGRLKENSLITFLSKKIVQTGPDTFEVQGDFTIRGVTKPETLTLTVSGAGTGSGEIKGTMAFDRKDYGMSKGIPFIKIADRVEVTVNLKGKRVSGTPLVLEQ